MDDPLAGAIRTSGQSPLPLDGRRNDGGQWREAESAVIRSAHAQARACSRADHALAKLVFIAALATASEASTPARAAVPDLPRARARVAILDAFYV
jgi:hypothetical protein